MATIKDIFYLDSTGVHVPPLQEVLDWYTQQYKNIYGDDVNLDPDTQDGQWIAIQAQALHDTMDTFGLLYNSFSPSTALSDGLDRNVRINGIRRRQATYSMCDVVITGAAGTVLKGASVKDSSDRIWNLPDTVIPLQGEITVTATASEPGAWRAGVGSLSVINTPTRGWQSVTNLNEATVGTAVETDAELRRRQGNSVAIPSQTILEGMVGAVATLEGVTRYKGYENDTNQIDTNGIPPHSSCLVIEGGDAQSIAEIILNHKTVGSGTYGDTQIPVIDRYGLETIINFQRPIYLYIKIYVKIKPLSGYINTYKNEIRQRLNEYINSLDIGDDVFINRLYPPILACNTSNTNTFDIVELKIGSGESEEDEITLDTKNIDVPFNGVAVTNLDLITVEAEGENDE